MAAVERLYLQDYEDYNAFRGWCMIYFPKMLAYFYDYTMNREDWDNYIESIARKRKKEVKEQYEHLGDFKNTSEAAVNLQRYYSEQVKWYKPLTEAMNEAEWLIENSKKSIKAWKEETQIPVAYIPAAYDRVLKWRCPLPFVRQYLKNQCGVNDIKWGMFYKIFWEGKREYGF